MGVYTVNQTDGSLQRVAGGTLFADAPIASIIPFGGETAPAGWLICDGSTVSRTEYAELFAVIGINFGVGDGETTFNLPDLREAVPKGAGLTGKTVGNHVKTNGLAVGEFLDDRMQEHQHQYESLDGSTVVNHGGTSYGGAYKNTINMSGRYGATTEVKSVGVNYIIKAKMVGVPADLEAQIDADYQKKDLAQAVEGETTVEDALGALSTNKADKVASATAGDIATLDANGNLVDSGVVASSVIRRVNPSTAVDCNDLIDRFTEYRVGDGDANRPTTDSNAYIISTFKTGAASTTYSQIAYQIGGTNIYRRNFSSTTWSPWEKLVTPSDLTDYQKKDLTTPITVGGTSQTTVESTLGALANLLIPVGTISAYGGSSAPSGYLLCNGSEVSKTTYASLYAVIGDKFGTASVNTKFRLPDLREATTKGVGLTSKSSNHYDADGLALGEFIDDRIKAHSHRIMTYAGGQTSISNVYGNTGIASNIDASDSLSYVTNVTRNGSKGPIIESTGSATTEVKAVGVNYIIKY